MDNLAKNKKIIGVTVVLVLLTAGFGYYFFGLNNPASQKSTELVGLITERNAGGVETVGVDKELFTLLNQLKSLSFNSNILKDSRFVSLEDFSEQIPPMQSGRRNPFLPIGVDPVVFVPSAEDLAKVNTPVAEKVENISTSTAPVSATTTNRN